MEIGIFTAAQVKLFRWHRFSQEWISPLSQSKTGKVDTRALASVFSVPFARGGIHSIIQMVRESGVG